MTEQDNAVTPSKCVPEQALYCRNLAVRVRGPIQMVSGLGFVNRTSVVNNEVINEHLGIAYRVPNHFGDNVLMLNYCPWCGVEILRERLDTTSERVG